MLWFNAEKDLGQLRAEDGERFYVPGDAFGPGEKPLGRCGGLPVRFDSDDGGINVVAFVDEASPRRARARRRH